MEYRKLKLYEPGLDRKFPTCPKLELLLSKHAQSLNAQAIRHEIQPLYRSALKKNGAFSISTTRLKKMYGSRLERKIITTVGQLSEVTQNYNTDVQCYQRQLLPDFMPRKGSNTTLPQKYEEQYVEHGYASDRNNGNIGFVAGELPILWELAELSSIPGLSIEHLATLITDIELGNGGLAEFDVDYLWLDGQRLLERQLKWTELAISEPSWTLNYCQGASKAGHAILESLADISLPAAIDFSSLGSLERISTAQRWLESLTMFGSPRAIVRHYGRVYHVLLFVSKLIRRACLLRGSPVAEIDQHATYPCLYVSRMQCSPAKDRLIGVLKDGKFYDPFVAELRRIYPHLPEDQLERLAKVEFQRQVLFPRNLSPEGRYLMAICHNAYSAMAEHLDAVQRKTKCPSKRSKGLMQRESEIWIDRILLECFDDGAQPVVPLHDGMESREQDASNHRQIAEDILTEELGFKPLVRKKSFANNSVSAIIQQQIIPFARLPSLCRSEYDS